MSAEAAVGYENPELASLRLLTEVEHFLAHMDDAGNVPDEVFAGVEQNRSAAAAEIAMPYAVTETVHEVVEREDDHGRRERVILWLGQTALQVASSGYTFHFSKPAYKRIPVEEAEAVHGQTTIRSGVVQSFVSPKMTRHDASVEIAKAEHLYTDDSIRTSNAITNEHGEVVGRRLRSLLVRHIPFEAWVAMFKDPENIFGKSFSLRDELSAVSVMELFDQMDLPESALPEGPVTLVEAVMSYIADELARQKVKRQLKRFRGNQELYARESKLAGKEWAQFDLELARSLKRGAATDPIRFFIMQNASAWNDDSLRTILKHELGNTQYGMTAELAALLSRAKQKLVGDNLAVVTDNDIATKDVSPEVARQIRETHDKLVAAYETGADPAYIASLQSRQYRLIHSQSIRSGGGCPGDVVSAFGKTSRQSAESYQEEHNGVGEYESPFRRTEGKEDWQWKLGICQVKSCPSPKPTDVGPCNVCRRCQSEFDKGHDPTKAVVVVAKTSKAIGATVLDFGLARKRKSHSDEPSKKEKLFTVA